MDRTLALLQNADPADPAPDSLELLQLKGTNLNASLNLVALPVTTAVGLRYAIVFQTRSVPLPDHKYLV